MTSVSLARIINFNYNIPDFAKNLKLLLNYKTEFNSPKIKLQSNQLINNNYSKSITYH